MERTNRRKHKKEQTTTTRMRCWPNGGYFLLVETENPKVPALIIARLSCVGRARSNVRDRTTFRPCVFDPTRGACRYPGLPLRSLGAARPIPLLCSLKHRWGRDMYVLVL